MFYECAPFNYHECYKRSAVSDHVFHRRRDLLGHWRIYYSLEIGRAHVWTPVTAIDLVCRLLLEKKKTQKITTPWDLYSKKKKKGKVRSVGKKGYFIGKTRETISEGALSSWSCFMNALRSITMSATSGRRCQTMFSTAAVTYWDTGGFTTHLRSEEHTSELQSQR